MLAAGLVILFPTLVNYVIWKRDYDNTLLQIKEYNKNPPLCAEDCRPPGVQAYDNSITWAVVIGSVIIAGGASGIIHGIKYDSKL